MQVNIDFDVDVDVDVDVYVDIDVDADIFMFMLVPIFLGAWQQAGNILRIKPFRPWLCETKHTWEGTPDEPEFLEALTQENGEVIHLRILKNILVYFQARPWGDRRQELVFIRKDLNHEVMSLEATQDDTI